MALGRKTGGRKSGTKNKATVASRELFNDMASGLVKKVLADIDTLDPPERVRVFLKICEFIVPKPQTMSLDVTQQTKETIEAKLRKLAEQAQK